MNIFALSYSPRVSAQSLCDKHVPKMVLETAQILCNKYENSPYAKTHLNHPCTKWAISNNHNYLWLLNYGEEICNEYKYRYNKTHKSEEVILWCKNKFMYESIKNYCLYIASCRYSSCHWKKFIDPFVQAMPESYKCKDSIKAYKKYYIGEKYKFAKWNHKRNPPKWWVKDEK